MRRSAPILASLLLLVPAIPARAVAGALDPRFGGSGVVTAFSKGAIGTSVSIDGHGRTVVVGYTVDGSVDVAVVRFRRDGTPDGTFDGDGRARVDLGADDYAFDVAVTPDDGLVIAGRETSVDGDVAFVLRLNPDGERRTRFGGGDGVKLVRFGKRWQSASAVAVDGSGRIVIGGYASNGTGSRAAFARLLPRGDDDTSFSGNGRFTASLGFAEATVNDLILRDDGVILAAGGVESDAGSLFAIVAVLPAGGFDPSFGETGARIVDLGPGGDEAHAITLRPDDTIAVAGSAGRGVDGAWGVVQLSPGGNLDPSFSKDGILVLPFTPASEEAQAVLATGPRLVVAGRVRTTGQRDDMAVVRLRADGTLDLTFGTDGLTVIDVDDRTDWASGLARVDDGRIVVGGTATRGGTLRLAAVRLLAA